MSMDTQAESQIGPPPARIDFDIPPTTIEDYKFGDPITRENFTSFLVDDFRRSKGQFSAQIYAWAWLKRHLGIDVSKMYKSFIDKKGLRNLTDEEQSIVQREFERPGRHERSVVQIMEDEDTSFSSHLSKQIDEVVRIWDNRGSTIIELNREYRVEEPKNEVLAMDRKAFLEWQRTKGQKEVVLIPVVNINK